MEYVYAAMLLHKAGKEINEENLKKVLEAAGVNVDEAKVKSLVAALEGVNIEETIKNASALAVAAPQPAAQQQAAETKQEEKKEEAKEEKKEEEIVAGLGSLFG